VDVEDVKQALESGEKRVNMVLLTIGSTVDKVGVRRSPLACARTRSSPARLPPTTPS
jgi:hypothetical protein